MPFCLPKEKTVSRIIPALLLIVALAVPTTALAAADKENTYNVEVLVFATRLPQFDGDELWTRETSDPVAPAGVDALPPSPTAPPNILAAAANDLAKDGRFRILAYYSWIQAADAKSASKPILLRGTRTKNPEELTGTMRLYLSRYLHLDLNLNYAEKPADGGSPGADTGVIAYRINEQRRVKSQETHYFDHPKFGALIRLTPLTTGR
jgi:hypothetical protein